MRVLLATGQYADTPGPLGAARRLAEGWLRHAPGDEVIVAPVSDGGTGFIEVLAHALGAQPAPVVVTGPTGGEVPAQMLLHEGTAYLEAGQAAGRHLATDLLASGQIDTAVLQSLTSRGVGELVLAALEAGSTRIVLGCGDLASHDGGLGMLQALGAGEDLADLDAVRDRLHGTPIVLAHATNPPLTGFHGASAALGTEHEVTAEVTQRLEEQMGEFTDGVNRVLPPRKDLLTGGLIRLERADGAGVGGGVGYAALLLGAQPVVGATFVIEEIGLPRLIPGALVVTGGAAYDFHTVHDGVIAEVARAALEVGSPSIVLADRVDVGRREGMSLGVSAAYEPLAGEELTDLAERVARTWSPQR